MIARTPLGRTVAVVLSLAVSQMVVPLAYAQAPSPHLVDPGQAMARLLETAKSRQEKVDLFQKALGTTEAQRQARAKGLDPAKLQAAVPHLSDKELADLASRAERAKDVTAGYHSDEGVVLLGVVLLLVGLAILVAAGDDYYDDYDCYCY